ncbi:glycosyltransferase [Enterococcus sp. LJL51]|uniref:glycosyltransferase n=1 Tax=Enterococcus sp. LJL51 TaxID=3416656 RepID=UPI003CEDAA51
MAAAIVIPSYEPQEKVVLFIQQLREELSETIIVVDDGSGNKYRPIFQKLEQLQGVKVCSYKTNEGKGHALKAGFQEIIDNFLEVEAVVTADSDGQHSIEDIQQLIAQIQAADTQTIIFLCCNLSIFTVGNCIDAVFIYKMR